jgi:hypothetical protein
VHKAYDDNALIYMEARVGIMGATDVDPNRDNSSAGLRRQRLAVTCFYGAVAFVVQPYRVTLEVVDARNPTVGHRMASFTCASSAKR